MTLLQTYTFLIRNREARRKERAKSFPDESDDERQAVLIAQEQEHLAREIPPYVADLRARIDGHPSTHESLLNGTMYIRSGAPTYCLLFLDTDGIHRIISFSPSAT